MENRYRSSLLQSQVEQGLSPTTQRDLEVAPFLERVDAAYVRFSNLQTAVTRYARTAAFEWNFANGRIEGNRQWKKLLEFATTDLDERVSSWHGLAEPSDLERLLDAVQTHVAGESERFEVDCRFRSRRGNWRWLRVAGQLVERGSDGHPVRALVVLADIDGERRNTAALEMAVTAAEAAARARTAFLANVSHEIRTPMNAIIGMTELALDSRLDEEQRHYLDVVKSSAESLLTLISDVLDFSKIEAGKLMVENVTFPVRKLVTDLAQSMALTAQEKGLEMLLDVAPLVPVQAVGDPTRLRQVLTNLLGNAIKFTESGEVAIEVSVDDSAGDATILHFCVRDTGIGIPEDQQQSVFEAFTQADASITRRYGGTGLGLTICSRLVEMLGGRMWVDSAPGAGSRFHFTARLGAAADADTDLRRIEHALPVPRRHAGKYALIVLRNASLTRQIARQLQGLGFSVAAVDAPADACAALARMQQSRLCYDLLISDAGLLLDDDAALVSTWQATTTSHSIIALYTLPERKTVVPPLRALGVTCVLNKPVADETVVEAIDVLLGASAAEREREEAILVESRILSQERPSELAILLVEDNVINQELAQRLLARAGHRVTTVADGEAALDAFEDSHFDVVLMDMQMPGMDGIATTEALREREMRRSWVSADDTLQGAYIIAVTANAMPGDEQRCLDAGMNDYLSKPLRKGLLHGALHRACVALGRPVAPSREAVEPEQEAAEALIRSDVLLDLDRTVNDLGDRELVLNLATQLHEQLDGQVDALRAALAEREAKSLVRHAHTLKGLLAMFHARPAQISALALERAGRARQWQNAERQLDALLDDIGRLRPQLAQAIGRDLAVSLRL